MFKTFTKYQYDLLNQNRFKTIGLALLRGYMNNRFNEKIKNHINKAFEFYLTNYYNALNSSDQKNHHKIKIFFNEGNQSKSLDVLFNLKKEDNGELTIQLEYTVKKYDDDGKVITSEPLTPSTDFRKMDLNDIINTLRAQYSGIKSENITNVQFFNVDENKIEYAENSNIINGILFQNMIPQSRGIHRLIRDSKQVEDRLSDSEWNDFIKVLKEDFKHGVFVRIISNPSNKKEQLTLPFQWRNQGITIDDTSVSYSVFGIKKSSNLRNDDTFLIKFANGNPAVINSSSDSGKYSLTDADITNFKNKHKQKISSIESKLDKLLNAGNYDDSEIEDMNTKLQAYNIQLSKSSNGNITITDTFGNIKVNDIKNKVNPNG